MFLRNTHFIPKSRYKRAYTQSTVHRGTAFEQRSQLLLQTHLSMSLQRVGGKSDGGVDLQGWWWLPSQPSTDITPRRIRVLAQCKAEKKKMGPNYVREMEGVMYRHLSRPDSPEEHNADEPAVPAVALLISESAFTSSTLLRAHSSKVPFFLLHLPPPTACTSSINAAFWNPALAQGLLHGALDLRWEREPDGGGGRPGLWWRIGVGGSGGRVRSCVPEFCEEG